MAKYVALFRGINVGGKNIVPMAELRKELGERGLRNVETYIQSGNVVFEVAKKSLKDLTTLLEKSVEAKFGFRPQVLLLTSKELDDAIDQNPYKQATEDPKSLHFYFLASTPKSPNKEKLLSLQDESESFELVKRVFYLHAPNGIGRSKLAAAAERLLGVGATARNYRTVDKLASMLKS